MHRKNFFDLLMVRASITESEMVKLAKHFIEFSQYALPEEEADRLLNGRIYAATPISKLYEALKEKNALEKFFTLFSFKGIKDVPQILDYRHICYDSLQMENAFPEFKSNFDINPLIHRKLLVNVTTMTKTTPSGLVLSDNTAFQSLIVRDGLCRSYYESGGLRSLNWISPSVDQALSKIYGLLLSITISRRMSLDLDTQRFVYVAFALYMLGAVTSPESAKSILSVKARYFYLNSSQDAETYIRRVYAKSPTDQITTLDDVIAIVNNLGIPRLQISRKVLSQLLKSISVDAISSILSLEYPPYFLWSALMSISGSKTGLSFFLKQQNLHKELLLAMDEITKSQNLELFGYSVY